MKTKSITALRCATLVFADVGSVKYRQECGDHGERLDEIQCNANRCPCWPGDSGSAHQQRHIAQGSNGHNLVLLKAGLDANAYAAAAMSSAKDNYEPKSMADQVLASVPLLGPKRQGEITFNGPTAPGTYQYLCSFPGHCLAGMRGQLVVK